MGDSGGMWETRMHTDRKVYSNGKVSDGKKGSIGNCTRGHLCYIVAKNLSTFFPCPETLWEAVFKGDGLIWL
jgi:hypothetical protein